MYVIKILCQYLHVNYDEKKSMPQTYTIVCMYVYKNVTASNRTCTFSLHVCVEYSSTCTAPLAHDQPHIPVGVAFTTDMIKASPLPGSPHHSICHTHPLLVSEH